MMPPMMAGLAGRLFKSKGELVTNHFIWVSSLSFGLIIYLYKIFEKQKSFLEQVEIGLPGLHARYWSRRNGDWWHSFVSFSLKKIGRS